MKRPELKLTEGKGLPMEPRKLVIKSKIWIEDDNGAVVFGAGRLHILCAVEEHGSILAASKALGMSYRGVWGKLRATEQRLGQPLLTKKTGGSHGGGSELTPTARALVERFRNLENLVRTTSDALFQGVFMDSMAVSADEAGCVAGADAEEGTGNKKGGEVRQE